MQDVISKFKKERSSLKSRILKLETRMNQMTFDETLEVKPAKGSKSVSGHPLVPEAEQSEINDSKSEGTALKQSAAQSS